MFDANRFKRSVKDWIRAHPEGTEEGLVDFCEEQIPPAQFQTNQWLVEQTLSWYRHILTQRRVEAGQMTEQDYEDAQAAEA